jgi:hypothetical protein
MLPGVRILFALIALSFAILIFGFSALALFRTAHQNLASQPAWQPDWRTPVEIANAQRNDHHPASETQMLALLRVDPPATRSAPSIDSPPASAEQTPAPLQPAVQPPVEEAQSTRPERDSVVEVKPRQPAEAAADTANVDDHPTTGRPAEPLAATDAKPLEPATTPARADDAAKPTASNGSEATAAMDASRPPSVQVQMSSQPAPEPDAAASSAKAEQLATERARSETFAPTAEPPIKLAALPDALTSTTEAPPKAGQQSTKKPDAAELRAKRRARARLRARRLALARARAARLAQIQQATTNSPFYSAGFPMSASTATNATPNATPYGPPRAAP